MGFPKSEVVSFGVYKYWFDAGSVPPWKTLEQDLVHPLGLQGVVFSGLKHKRCYSEFVSLVSYTIQTI